MSLCLENHPLSPGPSESEEEKALAPAARAEYQPRRLTQEIFSPHGSGGWKCQVKRPAGLGPGEASLPSLQAAVFSPVLP